MIKNFTLKNLTKTLIPLVVVIIIILAVALLYDYSRNAVRGVLPKEKAAQKALDFINNVALDGQATASLVETTEESGLYKIKLKIGDQEYESYVTKDAKLLFAQGTQITEETSDQDSAAVTDIPKSDTPKVELFVMSFCPYGNQAEDAMKPVAELLEDKADIQLHYVIYANYQGGGSAYCLDKDSKYCSMHGIQELNQDVRELCVQKYQQDKLWSFVDAVNNGCTYQNADSCWEAIAKNIGIDTNKIKTCQKNEAISLLEQEVQLNDKYGVTGSPQIVINDKEYTGGRSADAYKNAICSGFKSEPSECEQTLSNDGSAVSGGCE